MQTLAPAHSPFVEHFHLTASVTDRFRKLLRLPKSATRAVGPQIVLIKVALINFSGAVSLVSFLFKFEAGGSHALNLTCPNWQWHRTGYRWLPVRTLQVDSAFVTAPGPGPALGRPLAGRSHRMFRS